MHGSMNVKFICMVMFGRVSNNLLRNNQQDDVTQDKQECSRTAAQTAWGIRVLLKVAVIG